MTRDEFLERFDPFINNEDVMFADGFDEAILGLEPGSLRVVYSIPKMVEILIENEKMELLDAIEYLEYNVINAYVGDKTPIYIET